MSYKDVLSQISHKKDSPDQHDQKLWSFNLKQDNQIDLDLTHGR